MENSGILSAADDKGDSERREAIKIQNEWKTRKSSMLNADSRWADAAVHTELQSSRLAAEQGKNDPKSRWRRAAFLATRLRDDNNLINSKHTGTSKGVPKALETQHWLELTDSKHRYGSNLKFYHQTWLESDTTDNFFKWLDRGAGKDLSLAKCPRDKLERERIVYLSAEQRMNYLVEIDDKGLLRWARDHTLVDTSAGKWKDSGNWTGVVPRTSDADIRPELVPKRRTSFAISPPSSQMESVQEIGTHSNSSRETKDSSSVIKRSPVMTWIKRRSLANPLRKQLLRSLIAGDTWIYVADGHYNIYIGIKDTGTFQHSSFLSGGLVASAGLISVHEGLIHKLSPLSGHYRTKIENFREFMGAMEKKGVDTHRVEKLRAKVSLWGIQQVNKGKKFRKRQKQNVKSVLHRVTLHRRKKRNEKAKCGTDRLHSKREDVAQWKQDILLGRNRLAESVAGVMK